MAGWSPTRFDVSSLSNVIVDVTFLCRSFAFGQLRAKVSAVFTNVSGLAVAAFDHVCCFQ